MTAQPKTTYDVAETVRAVAEFSALYLDGDTTYTLPELITVLRADADAALHGEHTDSAAWARLHAVADLLHAADAYPADWAAIYVHDATRALIAHTEA